MRNIVILLAVSFLASCTMMERAGIEKRRYSAGYYIPPLFAKNKPVQKSSDIGKNASTVSDGKMEAITPLPFQPNTGNELASIDESARPVSDQASDAAVNSQAKVKDKLASLLNRLSPKVIQDYASNRSTLGFTDRKSLLHRGCGRGCGVLLVAAALILIILFVMAASPGFVMTPGIIFIACGVVLLIMLISLLIRESMRARHREEWHDHGH
jgi:hypothetical protein